MGHRHWIRARRNRGGFRPRLKYTETPSLAAAGGDASFAFGNRSLAWIFVAVSATMVFAISVVPALQLSSRTFNASASGDTYLSSYAPSSTYGTAPVLRVSHAGGDENWTLIQFDITGKLRPGDLVVQARMRLTVSDANAPRWPVVVTTGRTLTVWQENATTFETTPLFSFDTSTATVVGTAGAPSRGTTVWIDLTKQMRRWHSYAGPSNFGTVLIMGPTGANGAIGFASRDNVNLEKPLIEVTFQPGPRSQYGYALGFVGVAMARPE